MKNNKPRILLVDDNHDDLKFFSSALSRDFSILTASSSAEAMKLFSTRPDACLLDIRMDDSDPNNKEGLELLQLMKSQLPEVPIVMITAYGDVDIAVEAMKLGAADYIQKQKVEPKGIRKTIFNLLEKTHLKRKLSELENELTRLDPWEIVGKNPTMIEIKRLIDLVARDGTVTVLIRGETGTGKELVARAIYKRGVRKDGPFVPVAISSLTPSLIESELFGHEKGAFTGADRKKIGYTERAHGGILFLDEIGDLNVEAQIKLLRFLDHKTFTRVGGVEEIPIDIQLVAATNKNLEEEVDKGTFREDLYYRLKSFQIFLPPLRERGEDIPELANHFLKVLKSQGRTKLEGISDSAMEYLIHYPWPGNVRELKSCMEMAVIYAERNRNGQIMPEDLPMEVRSLPTKTIKRGSPVADLQDKIDVKQELARVELAYIERALERTRGKKKEAWKLLGYNDRFALRRRVNLILSQYPHLIEEFPGIKKWFSTKLKVMQGK